MRVLLFLVGLCLFAPSLPGRAQHGEDEAEKRGAAEEQILREAKVPTDNASLIAALRQRVLPDADQRELENLLKQLGSEKFAVRENAHAALLAQGLNALPVLRLAEQASDVEIKKQAEGLRAELESRAKADEPIQLATVRLLGFRKPAEATEVLLKYVPFAPDENIADEVRAALVAVNTRAKDANPVLLGALGDRSPTRRSAAAEVLCRLRADAPPVLALLEDRDPTVRLRVGMALLRSKHKQAVPVLIELLGQLPSDQLWQAQDLLTQLAGEKSPSAPLGTDTASRGRCRDAWRTWWAANEAKVDLTRFDHLESYLGYTLIVQQFFDRNAKGRVRNVGQVVELDANKKPRWKVEVPYYTVDAHVLDNGDRVLIAEYQGQRVTERNKKGEILWEKAVTGNPLAVQRLPNGNTFIVLQRQLLEVDRAGQEVFSMRRPVNDIFKARKMPNGDVAFVTSGGEFQRFDSDQKLVKRFRVGQIGYQFGSMDVLPTGGVVIGLFNSNRVVEFDADGKEVWSASILLPTSVVRLPSGRTLVASQNTRQVVELDRAGRTVWSCTAEGQVYQARRR
jgi:hypothetical protein